MLSILPHRHLSESLRFIAKPWALRKLLPSLRRHKRVLPYLEPQLKCLWRFGLKDGYNLLLNSFRSTSSRRDLSNFDNISEKNGKKLFEKLTLWNFCFIYVPFALVLPVFFGGMQFRMRGRVWCESILLNTQRPRNLALSEIDSQAKSVSNLIWLVKCRAPVQSLAPWYCSLLSLVRFPNPLAFGSGLGERTPKKVVFQLSESISQSKKILH